MRVSSAFSSAPCWAGAAASGAASLWNANACWISWAQRPARPAALPALAGADPPAGHLDEGAALTGRRPVERHGQRHARFGADAAAQVHDGLLQPDGCRGRAAGRRRVAWFNDGEDGDL